MRIHLTISFLLLVAPKAWAQQNNVIAHAHNDYEHAEPFFLAYNNGFGSIEADIYLINDSLFVAHHIKDISAERTLETLYINPVLSKAKADTLRSFQLLLDLKTDYKATLPAVEKLLEKNKAIFYPEGKVKVVISGSMPPPKEFFNYVDFIYFDGRPETIYNHEQLERVALISESAWKVSLWNRDGLPINPDKVKELINQTHAKGKQLRLWATPDTKATWEFLIEAGIDYLNTDKIIELANYLNNRMLKQ